MSTRSQMAIYEEEDALVSSAKVLLYRHSDGMPESVLPEIKPFLSDFNKVRGIDDGTYCMARLVQHLANLQNKRQTEMFDRIGRTDSAYEKESKFLGYGLLTEFCGDIEYFYHISPTAIKVYECNGENVDSWKLLKRIAFSVRKNQQVA